MRNLKSYLHPAQQYLLLITALIKIVICGRGWGKSTYLGAEIYIRVEGMPRSRGFILGKTYNQILTKFIPAMSMFWESIGIEEYSTQNPDGVYVVGKVPPVHFAAPKAKIKKYTNLITFINGTVIELLSMDRADLNLGGSYDWGVCDEIQGINYTKLQKEYLIAIRGYHAKYNHPAYLSFIGAGTMPWLPSQKWVLEYEDKMKKNPKRYFFIKRTSFDNIGVLGKEYFKNLRAELSPLMYNVEILNHEVKVQSGDGFYPEFSETRNTYTNAYSYSELEDESGSIFTISARVSNEYDSEKELDLSFDFNADVTSLIIGQEHDAEFRIINMIYETPGQFTTEIEEDGQPKTLVKKVVERFCRNYPNHTGTINIYGDGSGKNRSANGEPPYDTIVRYLQEKGYHVVNRVVTTMNPLHIVKHQTINDILSGSNTNCPKVLINADTCSGLIMSILSSPIMGTFQKNKTSERNKSLSVEQMTHFSDGLDYLLMGKYAARFAYGGVASEGVSISFGA